MDSSKQIENRQETEHGPQQQRPWWRKVLKIAGIGMLSLIALVLLILTIVVIYLKPERLTPLVEKYATEYIDGELTVDRVELTFWSTFPRFRVDVDNLHVISHSLRQLPEGVLNALPAERDSLLAVAHFDGDINILRLLTGEIEVKNVNIVRPAVNLVIADSEHANYNIFPTSEEVDTTSSGPLPEISLGSFVIEGEAPIRFYSHADSTDISVLLATSTVKGSEEKSYDLEVKGVSNASVTGFILHGLRIGLGGRVIFDPSEPERLEACDLTLGLNELVARVSTVVRAAQTTVVESFSLDIPKVKLMSIVKMLPEELRRDIPGMETDMTVAADVRLRRPFTLGAGDTIPTFDGAVKLDASHFKMHPLELKHLKLNVQASVDGHNLNNSVVTVKEFNAQGQGVEVEIDGTARNLMSDPLIDAGLKGRVDISRLPSVLLSQLPATVTGVLEADARVNTRLSYLDAEDFHRVRATGKATLNGFRLKMNDNSLAAYLNNAVFELGTSSSFVKDNHRVDSLLTASLKIDTMNVATPEMRVGASRMMAGVGASNRASSADTSQINPIGGTFKVGLLNFVSDADTMRVRLRDVNARALLTRYKGNSRSPLLALDVDAGRLRWADSFNRASLSDGSISVRLHPGDKTGRGKKPTGARRGTARRDSTHNGEIDSLDRREMIDMRVDRSMRQLLRQWQASGTIKAGKARVMTPYFPLKCRLENLNVNFTTDSIAVNNTRLMAGKSDFTINGYISNITRALTSSRGAAINVHFHLDSKTIDVNELAQAAFAGSAFAENVAAAKPIAISDDENDDAVEASIALNSDEVAALLVPSNVDAELEVHASKVSYADISFRNFKGDVRVHDGALNLNNLSASSDVGRVSLSALYSAPTRRDLHFAFGMQLKKFNIANFLEMMPAVDSLMPLLRDIRGIINADVVATTNLDPEMNIDLPSLSAALKLSGDSLVFLDAETFRTIGKWLLFKNKEHNMVDHMSVELTVQDSRLQLYPFMFDFDRYRLGVLGSNDLALNYDYHVSILKSPVPFKFGINLSGNASTGKMKVRLGGAKFKENMAGQTIEIADTTRINLLKSIENAFRAGVKRGRVDKLRFHTHNEVPGDEDIISHADSLILIQEGLIEGELPAGPAGN
ncbi:MAG: hypothetical protein J1E84_01175 [Muribaculaceae bacterium]|nr:hypothetical protein [Muribaculaceae bacterium]